MFGKYNGFVSKARVSACMYFLVFYCGLVGMFNTIIMGSIWPFAAMRHELVQNMFYHILWRAWSLNPSIKLRY
jgi:hypothetical protein